MKENKDQKEKTIKEGMIKKKREQRKG